MYTSPDLENIPDFDFDSLAQDFLVSFEEMRSSRKSKKKLENMTLEKKKINSQLKENKVIEENKKESKISEFLLPDQIQKQEETEKKSEEATQNINNGEIKKLSNLEKESKTESNNDPTLISEIGDVIYSTMSYLRNLCLHKAMLPKLDVLSNLKFNCLMEEFFNNNRNAFLPFLSWVFDILKKECPKFYLELMVNLNMIVEYEETYQHKIISQSTLDFLRSRVISEFQVRSFSDSRF